MIRIILDKFTKLSVVHALADQLSRTKEAHTTLKSVMEEAGQRSHPTTFGSDYRCGDYSDFEICLSRPSVSATNFLKVWLFSQVLSPSMCQWGKH